MVISLAHPRRPASSSWPLLGWTKCMGWWPAAAFAAAATYTLSPGHGRCRTSRTVEDPLGEGIGDMLPLGAVHDQVRASFERHERLSFDPHASTNAACAGRNSTGRHRRGWQGGAGRIPLVRGRPVAGLAHEPARADEDLLLDRQRVRHVLLHRAGIRRENFRQCRLHETHAGDEGAEERGEGLLEAEEEGARNVTKGARSTTPAGLTSSAITSSGRRRSVWSVSIAPNGCPRKTGWRRRRRRHRPGTAGRRSR